MIFLGLLSLFAFLGVSESAGQILTVTYNVTDKGVTSSQTFYITLADFSKFLTDITAVTDKLPTSDDKTAVVNAVKTLETVIPKLRSTTSTSEQRAQDLKTFSNALLALLQAMYKFTSSKEIQDLLTKLLTSILPPTPKPTPITTPTLPDLSTITLQIAALKNLVPTLTTLQQGSDKVVANIATNIINLINSLDKSTTPWSVLVQILAQAVTLYKLAGTNVPAQTLATNLIAIIKQALTNLPASVSGMSGLPALLISIIADLTTSGKIDLDAGTKTINSLSGSGKDILKNLIAALNLIISSVTGGLPEPLNGLFNTLRTQLEAFGNGAKNVPDILATLGKLVTAVTSYTGTNKDQLVSLMGIILVALKQILGNVPATNTELDRLLGLLNVKPTVPALPTVSNPGCSSKDLISSLLCTVGNLVVDLTGGGGNAAAPATPGAEAPAGGLGGILGSVLGGVLGILG